MNRDVPRRKNLHLQHYDYSQPGFYFLTICTYHHRSLFGTVVDGIMQLDNAGKMVDQHWKALTKKFENLDLHEHVVMPNHVHGIIEINAPNPDVPLSRIVQWFKTITTNAYIRGVKNEHWPPFRYRFWQRNYYEHVIRNDDSLREISEYICTNPLRWHLDRYYTL